MKESYVEVWNKLHKDFATKNIVKYDDWLEEFDDIIKNVTTDIIDLGCGVTGNNTIYLLEKGKSVISCDFAEEALAVVEKISGAKTLRFDMLEKFPFQDNFSELIIADLSLHYFRADDTYRIIEEIKRVLKPNGYLFVRVNSVNSTEYKRSLNDNNIKEIEHNLFFANDMEKRFFDKQSIDEFFNNWKPICVREENMSRYNPDKIVWKLAFQNMK